METKHKTISWKRSKMLSGLIKAGWSFSFDEQDRLYGVLEGFRLDLIEEGWVLFEDASVGLIEVARDVYSRRQTQLIKRELQKVKTKIKKYGVR